MFEKSALYQPRQIHIYLLFYIISNYSKKKSVMDLNVAIFEYIVTEVFIIHG